MGCAVLPQVLGQGSRGDMASQGQEGPFGECLAQAEMSTDLPSDPAPHCWPGAGWIRHDAALWGGRGWGGSSLLWCSLEAT